MQPNRRSFLVGAAAMMLMGRPEITRRVFISIAPMTTVIDPKVYEIMFAPIHIDTIIPPGDVRHDWLDKFAVPRDVPSMSPGDTGGQSNA